jgi:hypothetical protein
MSVHDTLTLWENFYVIVGSSAGALTGLQFVVMALVSESNSQAGQSEVDAFGSPNVVHFCEVLLVSSILSAPWTHYAQVGSAIGVCGVFGLIYSLIVLRRARRTTMYKPVLEDWIWHVCLPLLAYLVMVITAVLLLRVDTVALFGMAGSSLLLLFIGIHNAWDTVTWVTTSANAKSKAPDKAPAPTEAAGR